MSVLETAFISRNKKVNKIEKLKPLQTPLDFYSKFEQVCSKPFEALEQHELDYLLKCFGIFKKGYNSFMLRVRIPAGQLTALQAIELGQIAKEYGQNYIDITTRQQCELRFLKLKDLPFILQALEKIGLTSFQTASDNFRNIVTSSFDGYTPYFHIHCKPIIDDLQAVFMKNPKYFGTLPRKFNIGILGASINDCNIFGHDCSFVLAQKENTLGFNLYLGGKVGVQAQGANIFIKPHEVVTVFEALINLYLEYGFRDNRNKNRLYFLLQAVGIENFVQELKQTCDIELSSAGQLLVKDDYILDDSNTIALNDQTQAVHFCVPSGILTGSAFIQAGYLAQDTHAQIRLSVEQSFYLICQHQHLEFIKNSPLYKKYNEFNNIYFNNLISCTGANACSYGQIESKNEAIMMAYFLKDAVDICDGKIRMYWSACVKGCGIHGVSDIGFEGCKTKDEEGKTVSGVKIYLGGKITKEVKEARLLYKGVTLQKAKTIAKELISLYKDQKNEHESFEAFDTRVLSHYSIEEIHNKIGI